MLSNNSRLDNIEACLNSKKGQAQKSLTQLFFKCKYGLLRLEFERSMRTLNQRALLIKFSFGVFNTNSNTKTYIRN